MSRNPIVIDGQSFGKAEIEANREALIELRNAALNGNMFHYAVALSHSIALLHTLAEEMA